MIWSMRGNMKGSLGQALLRSLKSTQRHLDLSFFDTTTKLDNQSRCLISLMNLAYSSLASSPPMAWRFWLENRCCVFLTGLKPLIMFRLCLASLRGIPGICEGCHAKYPNFRASMCVKRHPLPDPAVLRLTLSCWGPSGALEIWLFPLLA